MLLTSLQINTGKRHKQFCKALKAKRKTKKVTEPVKSNASQHSDASGTGFSAVLINPNGLSSIAFWSRQEVLHSGGLPNLENVEKKDFKSVDDLPDHEAFLLSCSIVPNLEKV